eukprot:5718076-Prymnesium_polylepis.1
MGPYRGRGAGGRRHRRRTGRPPLSPVVLHGAASGNDGRLRYATLIIHSGRHAGDHALTTPRACRLGASRRRCPRYTDGAELEGAL